MAAREPRPCRWCGGESPRRNRSFCRREHYAAYRRDRAGLEPETDREAFMARVLEEVGRAGLRSTAGEIAGRLGRSSVYGHLRALVRARKVHRVGRGYFPASWLPAAREETPRADQA